VSVDHYENFPVASWLCPPALRPAVTALYGFARTADDLADEGDAAPAVRLAQLQSYRQALAVAAANQPDPEARWPQVFGPLRSTLLSHRLDIRLLEDLLSAFEQDVHNPRYEDKAQLLDYCRHSANPVGRLLLQLYGVAEPVALKESDAICSALQLINFWQDIGRDLARGRCYVPRADARRHGLDLTDLQAGVDTPAIRALLRCANGASGSCWKALSWCIVCPGAPAGSCGWWCRGACVFLRESEGCTTPHSCTGPH
jgi:hydroxysqualene synthase